MEMRNGLDKWATFVAKLVMTDRLSEHLGVHFSDHDVDEIRTLRELSKLIEGHLKDTAQAPARAVDLTQWAVAELERDPFWGRAASRTPLDFDAPLLDVLDPGRWDYADTSARHLALRRIQG
jgi:hypothetical protein